MSLLKCFRTIHACSDYRVSQKDVASRDFTATARLSLNQNLVYAPVKPIDTSKSLYTSEFSVTLFIQKKFCEIFTDFVQNCHLLAYLMLAKSSVAIAT